MRGKNTRLKKTFPNAYLIDMLDDYTFRNYIAHPERIKQIVKAIPQIKRCTFAAVQKAPALPDNVHSLIREYKMHQLVHLFQL